MESNCNSSTLAHAVRSSNASGVVSLSSVISYKGIASRPPLLLLHLFVQILEQSCIARVAELVRDACVFFGFFRSIKVLARLVVLLPLGSIICRRAGDSDAKSKVVIKTTALSGGCWWFALHWSVCGENRRLQKFLTKNGRTAWKTTKSVGDVKCVLKADKNNRKFWWYFIYFSISSFCFMPLYSGCCCCCFVWIFTIFLIITS